MRADSKNVSATWYPIGKVVEGLDILEKFQKVKLNGETPKLRIELRRVVVFI